MPKLLEPIMGLPRFAREGVVLGRRVDRGQRRRRGDDDGAVPAQRESQSAAGSRRRSSACCAITSACSSVLWLGEGVAGDDTDGHIDDIAALRRCVDDRLRDGRGSGGCELSPSWPTTCAAWTSRAMRTVSPIASSHFRCLAR